VSKPTSNRVLYLFLAVGVLVPIALAVAAWRFSQTKTGGVVWSLMATVFERMDSPGLAELRGIGCEQALMMTVGDLFKVPIFPDEDREKLARSAQADRRMVICNDFYGRRPTCEEVAVTYAPFAPDQDRAMVRVHSRGEIVCDGLYSTSGEFLAPPGREALFGEREPDEAGDEATR
jgi:hypothetical protein